MLINYIMSELKNQDITLKYGLIKEFIYKYINLLLLLINLIIDRIKIFIYTNIYKFNLNTKYESMKI